MTYTKYGTTIDVIETELNGSFWRDYYSYWENSTFDFIFEHLDKDKTFIDIGTWIGPISLVACQHSKMCLCFEPDPIAYDELIQNIELNGFDNIIAEKKAVSIHNTISIGSGILGHSETRDSCKENAIICECISISQILNKHNLNESDISILKMDVEGHESELLQDKVLWELNIPMHISFHPGWADNKKDFYNKIKPFLLHKGIDISKIETYGNFFDIHILPS